MELFTLLLKIEKVLSTGCFYCIALASYIVFSLTAISCKELYLI